MSDILDLDALEREGRPEPITFTTKGETFTTVDPYLMPWKQFETTDWGDTTESFKAVLSPEDFERFDALEVSQAVAKKLADRVIEVYFGGADQGE